MRIKIACVSIEFRCTINDEYCISNTCFKCCDFGKISAPVFSPIIRILRYCFDWFIIKSTLFGANFTATRQSSKRHATRQTRRRSQCRRCLVSPNDRPCCVVATDRSVSKQEPCVNDARVKIKYDPVFLSVCHKQMRVRFVLRRVCKLFLFSSSADLFYGLIATFK